MSLADVRAAAGRAPGPSSGGGTTAHHPGRRAGRQCAAAYGDAARSSGSSTVSSKGEHPRPATTSTPRPPVVRRCSPLCSPGSRTDTSTFSSWTRSMIRSRPGGRWKRSAKPYRSRTRQSSSSSASRASSRRTRHETPQARSISTPSGTRSAQTVQSFSTIAEALAQRPDIDDHDELAALLHAVEALRGSHAAAAWGARRLSDDAYERIPRDGSDPFFPPLADDTAHEVVQDDSAGSAQSSHHSAWATMQRESPTSARKHRRAARPVTRETRRRGPDPLRCRRGRQGEPRRCRGVSVHGVVLEQRRKAAARAASG